MRLLVRVLPAGKDETVELGEGSNGFGLMDALALNAEAHLILRDDTPLPVDEVLHDGDRISVVSVVSGG